MAVTLLSQQLGEGAFDGQGARVLNTTIPQNEKLSLPKCQESVIAPRNAGRHPTFSPHSPSVIKKS